MDELQRYGLLSIACAIVLALTFTFTDREAEAPLKPKPIHEKRDIAMAFEGGDDADRSGKQGSDADPASEFAGQPSGSTAAERSAGAKHPGTLSQNPSESKLKDFGTKPTSNAGGDQKKSVAPKSDATPNSDPSAKGEGKSDEVAKTPTAPTKPETLPGNEYVVLPGDTLMKIARTRLGDGKRWPEIVAANPNLNKNGLKPGAHIKLPSAPKVAGDSSKPPEKAATTAKNEKSEKPAAVAAKQSSVSKGKPKAAEPAKKHTVSSGETLSTIARLHYNDAMQWKKIYNANKSKMKSPSDIHKGVVLTLP